MAEFHTSPHLTTPFPHLADSPLPHLHTPPLNGVWGVVWGENAGGEDGQNSIPHLTFSTPAERSK